MSRVWRAARSVYFQRPARVWKDGGNPVDTQKRLTEELLFWREGLSCSQPSRVAATIIEGNHLSAGYTGEGPQDKELHMGARGREDRSAGTYQVPMPIRLGGTCHVQDDSGLVLRVPVRGFSRSLSSQILPEKDIEDGRLKDTPHVKANLEESILGSNDSVNLDEAGSVSTALPGEELGEDVSDEDSSLEEDGEEEPVKDDKAVFALWKKIESVRRGSQRSVLPTIKQWVAEGNALDKRSLISTVTRLRRRSRFKQAMEISDFMSKQKDLKWEQMDQCVRIDLKFKMKNVRTAEEIFEKSPPELKTEGTYNILLKNYSELRMVSKAKATMTKLKASGLLTMPFSFNQMLLLYKRKRMDDKIPALLEEMKVAGIARDAYTYNILMDVRGCRGDIAAMEEVFEEMKADEGVKPDAATYGTLASAYVQAGEPEKATAYLKVMEEGDFPRRRAAYDILIAQYATLGDIEGVERVWEKVKSSPVVSNRSWVIVLEAFGKLGKVERAEQVLSELQKEKGSVLTRQYNAMISVYAQQGMTDKAEDVLAQMVKAGRQRTAVTCHHLVVGYLKGNRLDKALAALKKIQKEAISGQSKPRLDTLLAILDEYAVRGNVVSAEKHFQVLKKGYPLVNVRAYNTLLKAYTYAKVPAGGFLQRMAADNVLPNNQTLTLLRQSGVVVETDLSQTLDLFKKTGQLAGGRDVSKESTVEPQVCV